MKLSDFDFELPEALIAVRPAKPRTSAKLLVAQGDQIFDHTVADLPSFLRKGDVLGVLYSGSLENGGGQRFDANYDFNTFSVIPGRQLFTFTLGSGQVIQGWDQALSGRRLGEVLDLVIPSELAYGSAGAPPSIPPDAPLRFRVELVGAIPAGESKAVSGLHRTGAE